MVAADVTDVMDVTPAEGARDAMVMDVMAAAVKVTDATAKDVKVKVGSAVTVPKPITRRGEVSPECLAHISATRLDNR
jgi:hypothetical protein